MWSHLHNKHGWDKDEATQWVRRQTGGSDDDEPDSGVAAAPDDEPENRSETPDSPPNQGDSEFEFNNEPEDPERSPERDEDDGSGPEEDAVVVQEEGSEKLSPDGFDSRNRPEMSPPEDADLPEDVTPDDFEPEESGSPEPKRPAPEQEDDDADESGGVLSKLRNRGSDDEDGAETESQSRPEEIVDEADEPEERERRQRVLDALNNESDEGTRDETPEQQPNQPEKTASDQTTDLSPKPAQMQNGMVVDEKLLETLFGVPFDQAANLTGWDGWRLSPEEKEANARLLRAWADEQDIDLGPGVMFAMSLSSTLGTRALGYRQYRKQESPDEPTPPSDDERQAEERQPDPAHDATDSAPVSETTQTQQTEQSEDQFDFDQPIGQQSAGA